MNERNVKAVYKWTVEASLIWDWYLGLSVQDKSRVTEAVAWLSEHGPAAGRPFVDTIQHSTLKNLEELRPRGGEIRILFAFDPLRRAILLVGGDKTGRENEWYKRNVPEAEARYHRWLRDGR